MRIITLTVLALILIAPFAAAMQKPAPPQPPMPQAPPSPPDPPMDLGKWWLNSEIVRQLGLNQEQTEKIHPP